MAMLTGWRVIFESKLLLYIKRTTNKTVTAASKGSVGRFTPTFNSKLLRETDNGVRKTISSSKISSEKIKSRVIKKITGMIENQ